jgi:hypothetical protein
MKTITIDITPAGTVTVDAQGFQGCGCAEATEQIELILGGGQRKRKEKPEYYAPAATGQQTNKLTF